MVHVAAQELDTKVDLFGKITILTKYLNYAHIFLLIFVAKLLKHKNNNYAIELKEDK